ncbi:unnamed protein product [Lepidochelys kempii]
MPAGTCSLNAFQAHGRQSAGRGTRHCPAAWGGGPRPVRPSARCRAEPHRYWHRYPAPSLANLGLAPPPCARDGGGAAGAAAERGGEQVGECILRLGWYIVLPCSGQVFTFFDVLKVGIACGPV